MVTLVPDTRLAPSPSRSRARRRPTAPLRRQNQRRRESRGTKSKPPPAVILAEASRTAEGGATGFGGNPEWRRKPPERSGDNLAVRIIEGGDDGQKSKPEHRPYQGIVAKTPLKMNKARQ